MKFSKFLFGLSSVLFYLLVLISLIEGSKQIFLWAVAAGAFACIFRHIVGLKADHEVSPLHRKIFWIAAVVFGVATAIVLVTGIAGGLLAAKGVATVIAAGLTSMAHFFAPLAIVSAITVGILSFKSKGDD